MCSKSERIRIGIIGTSGYAKLLLATLVDYDDAKLVTICGRTRSRADELAGEYRVAYVSFARLGLSLIECFTNT